MNKHDLFRDVLNEGGDPAFEEAVFRKTVAAARRAHRTRVAVRSGLALAATALLALQFWPRHDRVVATAPPPAAVPEAVSYKTITTQPFLGVLRTQAESPRLLASAGTPVTILTTAESGAAGPRWINDEELLALFKGQAVALANPGGPGADLVVFQDR